MKKLIALLLALVMVLSFVACSGETSSNNQNGTTETPETSNNQNDTTETPETTVPEVPQIIEYAIGESFGTDSVECVVTGFKWITPEEFDSVSERTVSTYNGENYYRIKTQVLFPECEGAFGDISCLKSEISDSYFLLVTFSLQNIGKEIIESTTEWLDAYEGIVVPYGTFEVIYDDGYTFQCGKGGFTTTLEVLGDAVQTVGGCQLKKQVFENEDKSLKLKVILPNSNGETEEFIVFVR